MKDLFLYSLSGDSDMSTTNDTTRRDFLKTTAVAAAGSALALAGGVHAAGSDTIKVGLIGCGGRGTGAAHNVLSSAPERRHPRPRRRLRGSRQGLPAIC